MIPHFVQHAQYDKMRPMVILRCRLCFSVVLTSQKIDSLTTGKELWRSGQVTGSRTGLVMWIVHARRPLALVSPFRECALTRATLSRSQADGSLSYHQTGPKTLLGKVQ